MALNVHPPLHKKKKKKNCVYVFMLLFVTTLCDSGMRHPCMYYTVKYLSQHRLMAKAIGLEFLEIKWVSVNSNTRGGLRTSLLVRIMIFCFVLFRTTIFISFKGKELTVTIPVRRSIVGRAISYSRNFGPNSHEWLRLFCKEKKICQTNLSNYFILL